MGVSYSNSGSSSTQTSKSSGSLGGSSLYNGTLAATSNLITLQDGTGESSTSAFTSLDSGTQIFKYTPSTASRIEGTRTVTDTLDVTYRTQNRTEGGTSNLYLSGDTTYETHGNSTDKIQAGIFFTNYSTTTDSTQTLTAFSAPTTIGSSVEILGFSTVTTALTIAGDWYLAGTSTSSILLTTSTTGTPTTTTFSSWGIADTGTSFGSSQTTLQKTDSSITYSADFRSVSTTTTLLFGGTYTVGHSTSEATNHHLSPLADTVCLMNAGRNIEDYNLGNQLWVFSLGSLAASAVTQGRFTNLFSSVSAASYTLADYRKFSVSAMEVTAITVSHDTSATVTTTAAGTVTGTSAITVSTTWKNLMTWNGTDASNEVTATLTVDLGDVSTSLRTENVGDPVTVLSFTDFYGTYEQTGYDSSGWTSTTAKMFFPASSENVVHSALYSPATTTLWVAARKTTLDEILVNKFSSVGTSWQFIGLAKTTTTRVWVEYVSTTQSVWLSELNPEVENYTTQSNSTYVPNGVLFTGYSKSETLKGTYLTESRLLPRTRSAPYELFQTFADNNLNQIWYRAPAAGYGGAGGNVALSSIKVYLSLSIGLESGGAFGSQTLFPANLAIASAYPGVIFSPARTDYLLSVPAGAVSANYLSRISSLGQVASVAVTWTSTTVSGTSTLTTSTFATYNVAGASEISGELYRTESLVFNTSDVRGGGFFKGGFALGDNALSSAYTVRLHGGYAEWTAYDGSSSVSSGSSKGSSGSVAFTIPGSLAIVFNVEPLISMSWGPEGGYDHFQASTPYFPT